MTRLLLARLAAAVLVLVSLALPVPAPAQEEAEPAPAAAEETTAAQARALVDVLRDEAAREALVAELERLAGEAPPEEALEETAEDEPAALSLGRQIALATQGAAEAVAGSASELWRQISAMPRTLSALDQVVERDVVLDALEDLVLVVLATYAALLILRAFAKRLYASMGRVAEEAGPARTVLLAVLSVGIDAAVVALAWAAGYAITLSLFGEFGSIGIRQTLYLNAFLVVEMARVAIRAVLSPTTGELRFIAISDAAARTTTRAAGSIAAVLGYGQLLLVPIANQNVSYLAGRALSSLIAVVAILIAIVLVVRSRRAVAEWLLGEGDAQIRARFLRWLARRWHWPVLVYLFGLLVLVVARPGGILFPVLGASAQILAAMLVGMMVTGVLGRVVARGVSLPEPVTQRLPLLERRLNTFVPPGLIVLRLLVFLLVVAFALDVIGFVDFRGWLESRVGVQATATMLSVLLILVGAFLVWLALSSWVDYRLNPEYGRVATTREQTLLTLLRNAATIAIIVVTLMFVLSELGIDIAPLLASAGVLGLAIGFGAQKMVQDIITGVFIQFENAINVGEVITVGGITGTVERLTIRSVSLRDVYGTFHIIPFSSVDLVSNFNKDFAYMVLDMGIAYQEDVDEARAAMEEAYARLAADPVNAAKLLGELEWFGLQAFGDSAVVVRVRIKTVPGQQWGIGRAYNAVVKQVFDERGIEIPFPHQTLYWGELKNGATPALRVSRVGDEAPEPSDDASPGAGRRVSDAPPPDPQEGL